MKILKIPHDRSSDGNPYSRTLQLKKEMLANYDLIEKADYDCQYVTKGYIELRFYDQNNPAVSLFALKYS